MENKIESLVKAYNEAENKAYSLLEEIFYLLKANGGYRRIEFTSGDVLTNCWKPMEKRFDKKLFLSRFERNIKSINAGVEKHDDSTEDETPEA
jgi:hypothetical protein